MVTYLSEINTVIKKYAKNQIKVALIYPNKYQIGINSLAIQILYYLFNSQPDVFCERLYLTDKLKSLETGKHLNSFDVIAVTFQYETDYFNFLKILKKANIPLLREERKMRPLIIAGGPCVTENPVPLSKFIDIFIIGEIEPIFNDLMDMIRSVISASFFDLKPNVGFYIPKINEDKSVFKSWVRDLNSVEYPIKQVLPIGELKKLRHPIAFGSSFLMEISRGCPHLCSFCLIGWQTLPYRERSINKIEEIIEENLKLNKIKRVSFIASAFSDYSSLIELLQLTLDKQIYPIFPSLRVDKLTDEIIRLIKKTGEETITLAPETATDRLHKLINKNLSMEQILNSLSILRNSNIKRLKLYFMFGLPSETIEETMEIVNLIKKIKKMNFRKSNISITLTPFIPKPHTVFQFEEQLPLNELLNRGKLLFKELCKVVFEVKVYDVRKAHLQTILSRGDKKIGEALKLSLELGGGLTGWKNAIKKLNIKEEKYTGKFNLKNYPWKFIKVKP
ncbi:MAG: B12-binding domain-containing radical SAM protein [Candidatus Odinarchaeia archaeon]